MHKQDYCQILGLNQNATERDAKTAFIKLTFQYHPELNGGKDNEERFKEIYAAYIMLRDEHFVQSSSIQSLNLSLESILYDLLEISKDASEQDIDKAFSNLACQHRLILKDFGYRSILDLSEEDANKLKKLYKAYTVMKQKAKRQQCDQLGQHIPDQAYAGKEASYDFSLEDILYGIKEFAREFGLDLDEKSLDSLGIFPLGRQVVNDAYWHAQHLLSDVLGIRVKGKVKRRRLF